MRNDGGGGGIRWKIEDGDESGLATRKTLVREGRNGGMDGGMENTKL